jgi:hypothetical protein
MQIDVIEVSLERYGTAVGARWPAAVLSTRWLRRVKFMMTGMIIVGVGWVVSLLFCLAICRAAARVVPTNQW